MVIAPIYTGRRSEPVSAVGVSETHVEYLPMIVLGGCYLRHSVGHIRSVREDSDV